MPAEIELSPASDPVLFPACCVECLNPIIVSTLYDGDTYIPFSLNMPDGTQVYDTLTNSYGTVINGSGVIELSEALSAGASVQIKVDDSSCKSASSVSIIQSKQEDCDCVVPNNCHVRVMSVSVKSSGTNLVSLSYLSVEANGELRYRLDGGEWFSDWASIGSFSSLVNHTLGIKLVNNPACRIEYPFLAISYT